ncbi:AP2-like ethylene-responsive transcription factor PLT1 [Coffea eugenioides]|uniref:AP2-like ethylene-responsive transcription factor PLT1 n=1 Tax=Coffea eugenioides TaxID=49369 RepID=UPI000F5D2024|nr:AP2-like ethylene-responsive transcription factor PLT1 [Coffea arabica]XP_027174194.1 AP2-like ethylene-responsive transcription factor PLT1 [Coffea eugenioides]
MASSSTAIGSPSANQSVDQSAAENSGKNIAPEFASTQGESSEPSLVRGSASAYSGVNKVKDSDHLYTSFGAYVKTRGRSGRYADEEEAARVHDIVTLKCSGARAKLNFPASHYRDIMRVTRDMDDEELLAHVRKWFAHKASKKRGQYVRTFGSEEEAAMAYDIGTIKEKGWNAQTNFSLALYDVAGIWTGTTNPPITEEAAKYLQQATMCRSSGEAQGHSSSGYHSLLHQVQIPFFRYSQTLMHLLSAHPNSQAYNVVDSSAQNMFSHSSSGPFKPYVKN